LVSLQVSVTVEEQTFRSVAKKTATGVCGCVFITAVPITKLFAWGEGDSGGHVLLETTGRGLSGQKYKYVQ